MYDKKRVKLPTNITLDYILSKVTEYDIYAQYIGSFKVGMIYNSPFRKDKNPSLEYIIVSVLNNSYLRIMEQVNAVM